MIEIWSLSVKSVKAFCRISFMIKWRWDGDNIFPCTYTEWKNVYWIIGHNISIREKGRTRFTSVMKRRHRQYLHLFSFIPKGWSHISASQPWEIMGTMGMIETGSQVELVCVWGGVGVCIDRLNLITFLPKHAFQLAFLDQRKIIMTENAASIHPLLTYIATFRFSEAHSCLLTHWSGVGVSWALSDHRHSQSTKINNWIVLLQRFSLLQ